MKAKRNKNGTFVGYALQKPVTVKCKTCDRWWPEEATEFVDIEEDIQGADVLTFKCPRCNTVQKSRRYT